MRGFCSEPSQPQFDSSMCFIFVGRTKGGTCFIFARHMEREGQLHNYGEIFTLIAYLVRSKSKGIGVD
jgi:hypothetical protein